MLFLRQIWALTWKNILLILYRHPFTTPLRAFLLPVIFVGFLSYARNLFLPPSRYGIGTAEPIRSFHDALGISDGSRETVAFVNNGFTGGNIQKIIDEVAGIARTSGKTVQVLGAETDLLTTCRSSIRGVSTCFAAAVFYASPDEGPGGMWNYSLRADGGLGSKIDVKKSTNDAEIYVLPLQHEIDFAIARQNSTIDQSALPQEVFQYPFTNLNQDERDDQIRTRYMSGIVQVLAVAYFIGMVGVVYQLVGLIASERELGMTQIIEASMPNRRRWEPRIIRYISYHLAFDIMFAAGWVVIALVLGFGIFQKTSKAILIIFHLLAGFSLSSFSIFGGAFFHKAQLSGISTTITALLLAVVAQVAAKASTGAVAVLSLLFPPMNYTYFTILMARWERQDKGVNLVKAAPENPSTLPGIVFWVLLVVQIVVFPILAYFIEGGLYGTASKGRMLMSHSEDQGAAVRMSSFVKRYKPSWWARNVASRLGKTKETVVAVNELDLDIAQGQIMVLLGANGSGKSTTLEAIAGLNPVTSGTIEVDGQGGIGICPQRNVLWDRLTTLEHVQVFNRLKSTGAISTKEEMQALIQDCDLDRKINSQARHLSGGQKRKLQLSMMFTGGSKVCCVDECSSGVDALARQKLWNILLNERGKRTFIFTTHFLDEADLLSDQIAILSKGRLKAQGSAVELKHRLGGGYRIHILKTPGEKLVLPAFEGFHKQETWDRVTYTLPDSKQTADCVRQLEEMSIKKYEISSPTIEEIFFNVAEDLQEVVRSAPNLQRLASNTGDTKTEAVALTESKASRDGAGLQLQTGAQIGVFSQAFVLFRKRFTVFQRNYLPYAAALFIPIVAAGLVTLFLKNFTLPGCSPTDQVYNQDIFSLLSQDQYEIPVGPTSRLAPDSASRIESSLPGGNRTSGGNDGSSAFNSALKPIEGLDAFNENIAQRYKNVTPGGLFLGDGTAPPTFAVKGNTGGGSEDIAKAAITQNLFDTLITNITISSQYASFDVAWAPGTGKTLQLITYFGLAMAAYPAFFALYPTLERLRSVRQLHYSNGVRSVTLWSAYVTFDFMIVLAASVICIAIFRGVSDQWYAPGYLFIVLFLYGLASTLLSYVISLFAKSQLSSFAFAAGYQAVMFLLYFIAYLSVLTYIPPDKVSDALLTTHFTIALITPSGNLIRALFVALNVFATSCQDKPHIASYPGQIALYGGPILYLIGQSIFFFLILLWWDSASLYARIRHKSRAPKSLTDPESTTALDADVAAEASRVASSGTTDGLRVQHISKSYGRSNLAVDDISFGVKRGEVFALLGPNGAGKSTTISLIRGDILPSHSSGEIYVENVPISKRRDLARTHIGVCPQVDACDQMTVLEHLRFYARVRGVRDVEHNVQSTILAVGLEPFQHRMAAALSGGNKRKLSLAIALMGNPSVLLLDEPSSGMDVCAKRVMWRTLSSVLPGRSLLLTTHSMEEADALADRAGIMGRKMLAIGTSEGLRRKFGDRYHVHLIMRGAPHTPDAEMERIKSWVGSELLGAEVEEKTFHGQLRFSVPAHSDSRAASSEQESEKGNDEKIRPEGSVKESGGIGPLFTLLEAHKEELGFEYYSVSQTTLDQVFLAIVGKHKIEEENYGSANDRKKKAGLWGRFASARGSN
ncbi:uncharacterized protein KY384_005205 [Bacidia gigantensis]|uniref:uncharacterized protein n=1 Tax=Bacidia gigantensis TaxID=2732470 RepID=UPI001D04036D|nr:uncharacterized protein KY384_005205 [Bacidia gigantensis]KAG8529724.1 hypothetical protein KY384_005205 [Bacidia gigantensis]